MITIKKKIETAIIVASVLVVIIVGTIYLYMEAHAYATAIRGYEAIGGEVIILFWPMFVYIAYVMIRDFREFWDESEAVDADYTRDQDIETSTTRTGAAAKTAKRLSPCSISTKAASKAFAKLSKTGRREL